ncbi:transcriptional regulator [Nocardia uniformis]|uniref:Transcriptional regulator n=1 Tax=Nocardia uniformis TaxID=53432 RepID=A0A849CG22_9NOCA|nr:transcriptional regulator [Nocardia uniformis]NNH74599.1 transcriptional regulator [Nocardia uniformis]
MSAPHRRPALIILVVASAAVCLALGYWQWSRFESGNGTGQNLGYALQWPLFAGFAVWSYFRFVRLEKQAEAEVAASSSDAPAKAGRSKSAAPREIPAGLLPERPKAARDDDPVLAEYNKYLADLHAHDIEEQMRDAGLHTDTERSAG